MAVTPPFFENNAGHLIEDQGGFLRVYWDNKGRTIADSQALFAQMLMMLRRRNWGRILINQVGMQPFTSEEQQWVAHEWLPKAVREGGYRFGAVVVSPQVLTRLATAYITTQVVGLPLTYRSFEEEREATAWLKQQLR